jgi:lipopolysaccharide/colanic/teichoic acid biosynthesis glycosyltransferase
VEQPIEGSITKRTVDIVIALVLCVVTLPILVVAALVAAIQYRAWPFFTQVRLGRHGRPLRMVKIRSLPAGTPRYTDKYSLADTTIPPLMAWMRRTHLDELPQLWLVLGGRMSLVGPRPEMAVLHDRLPAQAATTRLLVRPGVTGLWQVGAHCDRLICERPEYDLVYVTHRSLLLDTWILGRTLVMLVTRRTVHLHEVPRWAVGRTPALVSVYRAGEPV